MNKAELIEAMSGRLGDRKSATAALDAVLTEIQNAVTMGDKVSITGFGVFEKRVRAARTARNPRTGESVKVKKTAVPAFRPGAGFKEIVAAGKLPKATPAARAATKAAPGQAGCRRQGDRGEDDRREGHRRKKASPAAKATTAKKAAPAQRTARTAPPHRPAPPPRRRRLPAPGKHVRHSTDMGAHHSVGALLLLGLVRAP